MAIAKWNPFGAQHTPQPPQPQQEPKPVVTSADAKKIGLENFGNTCYANSVLQALYFCAPFRELLLQSLDLTTQEEIPAKPQQSLSAADAARRKPERRTSTTNPGPEQANGQPAPIPPSPASLSSALRSLYKHISCHPAEKGTVAPKAFIDKLKELHEEFRSNMQQDAQEFLIFLLNKIHEELKGMKGAGHSDDLSSSVPTLPSVATGSNVGSSPEDATLVHRLFEGVLTSETRCLTCESVSSRDECFLDLSIDIEPNSSVSACLRQFSASEMLCQRNKFFCDGCCDLQEAEKRMKIKRLPNVLALHLKRFEYHEDVRRHHKLAYRVAFPLELRLFNTVDDTDDADRLYELFGIVVHIGSGPHHGHYISIIKSMGSWLVFDDENVTPISENDITKYFGDTNSGSAYMLYYQAVDIDLEALGLRPRHIEARAASSSVAALSCPPGLTEEGDSSDLSDPPFPVTPSQPSLLSSFEQDNKHDALKLKIPTGATTTSPASSPTVRVPSARPSMPALPTINGSTKSGMAHNQRQAGDKPVRADTLPLPITSTDQPSATKSSSTWFRRRSQVKKKEKAESAAVESSASSSEPLTSRSTPWAGSTPIHPLEKSHHSTKIESNGTRDLPAAKPDSLPIHDGVYGSNTSRASLSSSSQASYSQSTSTSSQPPPPPTSFHKQRTSRQYTIDSLPRIPGSPEHKKSFTNLLQGKTSSVLPARPSTAGAAPHRHSMKDRDLPPIPTLSPISPHPNHLRPQSTAGFTTTAEKLASLDAYAGANQGKHRTSKYGHYPSPIQEAPSIVPITSENSSGGNSSNSSSGLQKARRKLSLTAPLLGFGKRDKHKPSHNEVAAS